MSLEAAIQANTAELIRVHGLLAQLLAGNAQPALADVGMPAAVVEPKKTQTKKETVQPAAKVEPVAAVPPTASTNAQAAAVLDYNKDVKPKLLEIVAKKNREALFAMLAEFGVQNGQQLKPEQLPKALERATELLAG